VSRQGLMDACFNRVNLLAVLCAGTARRKEHTRARHRDAHGIPPGPTWHTVAAHSKQPRAADTAPVQACAHGASATQACEGAEEEAAVAGEAAATAAEAAACGTHVHQAQGEQELETGAVASCGFLARMAGLVVAGGAIFCQRLRMQQGSKPQFTAHNNPAGIHPRAPLRAGSVCSVRKGKARAGDRKRAHMAWTTCTGMHHMHGSVHERHARQRSRQTCGSAT